MARDETWTPDGVVKKAHSKAVIDCDGGSKSFALKSAHKLTSDHLDPKYYQKMNVAMAFHVFSTNVYVAMNLYKSYYKDLFDCDSTIKFIERINSVINAMTSRSPDQALSYDSDRYKIITDFRIYLEEWQYNASEKEYHFMSASTYHGFQVTLKTTIAVMNFLTEQCGYKYLMTSRLNQDALEGFFGMIRGACGSNDHSDSLLFIQVYRFLSFYSLVKPPKGSNVQGIEIFETLLQSKDIVP